MKNGDFILKINANYNRFTKAEKRVADFVLCNPNQVLFMSITDLADACGVGDTSVFRFCKTLQLQGYQEFRMQLSLSMNVDSDGQEDELSVPIRQEDPLELLIQKVLHRNVCSLNEAYGLLKPDELMWAADAMAGAERLYFFSCGFSHAAAEEAELKFSRVTTKVSVLRDANLQLMKAVLLSPNDTVILFSDGYFSRETERIAEAVKQAGAKLISIAAGEESRLAQIADAAFFSSNRIYSEEDRESGRVGQLFLLDTLYTEFYRRTREESEQNRKRTELALPVK